MEKKRKYKVKIKRTTLAGSSTKNRFGLDNENGYMESMCGEIFHIDTSPTELKSRKQVRMPSAPAGRHFTFCIKDIQIIEDLPPELPKPEIFNPKLLDV